MARVVVMNILVWGAKWGLRDRTRAKATPPLNPPYIMINCSVQFSFLILYLLAIAARIKTPKILNIDLKIHTLIFKDKLNAEFVCTFAIFDKCQKYFLLWYKCFWRLENVQKSSLNTIQARIVITTNHQFHLNRYSKYKSTIVWILTHHFP